MGLPAAALICLGMLSLTNFAAPTENPRQFDSVPGHHSNRGPFRRRSDRPRGRCFHLVSIFSFLAQRRCKRAHRRRLNGASHREAVERTPRLPVLSV